MLVRRPFLPFLALVALVAAAPAPATEDGADAVLRMVRERLAAESAEGSLDAVREIEESLRLGRVRSPERAAALRQAALESLRPVRSAEARGLATRIETVPVPRAAAAEERSPLPFSFPEDEGAHGKLSEWWYWNGHLFAADGRRFGYQLCFFRVRLGIYFVHFAVSDVAAETFVFDRRFHRPSKVTATRGELELVYGDATATGLPGGVQALRYEVGDYRVEIDLTPTRDPMIVNGDGWIDMPEGGMSRYYSRTSLDTSGRLVSAGEEIPVTGQSWFDHQWGTFWALARPWDWFCVQMDDGTRYNLFSFREGSWHAQRAHVNRLSPAGELSTTESMDVTRLDWWESPHSGKHYVTRWRVDLPEEGESLEISATLPDQEMHRLGITDFPPSYWEGGMDVVRTGAGGHVTPGRSYSEHFPYRRPWSSLR